MSVDFVVLVGRESTEEHVVRLSTASSRTLCGLLDALEVVLPHGIARSGISHLCAKVGQSLVPLEDDVDASALR
jgi:hypothetical protein